MVSSSVSEFLSKYFLCNYFLLMTVDVLLVWCGLAAIAKFELIILLSAIIISLNKLRNQTTRMDLFIIFFSISIAIASLSNIYPQAFWFEGVRYQLFSIIFFFVGESSTSKDWDFFDKSIIPVLVVCFIGLILYITSPSWYVDFKLSGFTDNEGGRFLEMTRLSAFWTYPYWVSYGSGIIYFYLLFKSYKKGRITTKIAFALIFLAVIMVLAQQRVPIAFVALITLTLLVNSLFNGQKRSFSTYVLFLLLILVCCISIVFSFLDQERLIFMLSKFESLIEGGNASFLKERTNIFSDFYSKKITFWGDGIGRYGHEAYYSGKMAITDQQYLKIMYETGYFGIICYSIFILLVVIRGIRNFKDNLFELGIIFFYLMAMTGANCLSVTGQHCIVFWFCCGRIFNKSCLTYKCTSCYSLQKD